GYWESDSLRFASGGNVSYGWKTTLEGYKTRYPNRDMMGNLTFTLYDVKVISEKDALVFGKWHLKRKADEPWGLFTLLFKKTSGGWKIIADHTSSASLD
ncbi:YybH family protein, partial [Xanthovirga aplysinae]|uniref:YybH family protein n=1 Tax=Xanthovirga aplysinae TaxID=2529853 RepID=UPI001CA3CFA7